MMSQPSYHRTGHSPSPKAAVLREEFVALTKDPLMAIVLNQLLYWTQRVKDFDLFLQEERFLNPDCNVLSRHGWIYKSANELIEETMICVDRTTMRRYLKDLIAQGWLEERHHPNNRWDKTSQYRLNLRKLQEDLASHGYSLPGIDLVVHRGFLEANNDPDPTSDIPQMAELPNGQFALSNGQISPSPQKSQENPMLQNAPSNGYSAPSKEQIDLSNVTNCPLYIQRIQTENKNREQAEPARVYTRVHTCVREDSVSDESASDKSVAEEMVSVWDQHVGPKLPPANRQKDLQLTNEQKEKLASLLAFHFSHDMRLWERFCLRVKASSFCMGGGTRGWWANLEWVLRERNILKVLDGNYDDRNGAGLQRAHSVGAHLMGSRDWDNVDDIVPNPAKEAEKAAILDSIKDPIWKAWCTRLAAGIRFNESRMLHKPLSVSRLKEITNAWFLECEDERLVWIGSNDPAVLNTIENLRLQISWVYEREYPEARTLRTRLDLGSDQSVPQSPIIENHHHKGEHA